MLGRPLFTIIIFILGFGETGATATGVRPRVAGSLHLVAPQHDELTITELRQRRIVARIVQARALAALRVRPARHRPAEHRVEHARAPARAAARQLLPEQRVGGGELGERALLGLLVRDREDVDVIVVQLEQRVVEGLRRAGKSGEMSGRSGEIGRGSRGRACNASVRLRASASSPNHVSPVATWAAKRRQKKG